MERVVGTGETKGNKGIRQTLDGETFGGSLRSERLQGDNVGTGQDGKGATGHSEGTKDRWRERGKRDDAMCTIGRHSNSPMPQVHREGR
jgi:hypothetical protein